MVSSVHMTVINVRHMFMNVNDGVMPVLMTMRLCTGIVLGMPMLMMLIGMRMHVVMHRSLMYVRMNV